jgi:DNA-binding GntR family transcriptional regulator
MTPKNGEAAKRFAVDALRKALLDGDMVVGQRLVEPDLAEKFDISRSSVRAALLDLAVEGLVERIPNKGARVRVVPVEEAVEINECRMVLDGLCASKAAECATEEQIGELRELGKAMTRAVEDGEPLKYSALNFELYRSIRQISGQVTATRLLERLHEQVIRHQFRLALGQGRPQAWLPEHLAIVDAIARHDAAAAEAATRTHLGNISKVIKALGDAPTPPQL